MADPSSNIGAGGVKTDDSTTHRKKMSSRFLLTHFLQGKGRKKKKRQNKNKNKGIYTQSISVYIYIIYISALDDYTLCTMYGVLYIHAANDN